jgi:hypothetical protein
VFARSAKQDASQATEDSDQGNEPMLLEQRLSKSAKAKKSSSGRVSTAAKASTAKAAATPSSRGSKKTKQVRARAVLSSAAPRRLYP